MAAVAGRSWRWLSVRILQLLTVDTTRLHRAIYPERRDTKEGGRGGARHR